MDYELIFIEDQTGFDLVVEETSANEYELFIEVDTGIPGPKGETGADGKTILNGTVDPTTEGVDGDFYINTATNTLFGPKATTWPAGVSLVGPAGADGTDGQDGADGGIIALRTEAAAFSLSATDANKYIRYTGADAINLTVPNTLETLKPVTIEQAGAGQITPVADAGLTLNGDPKTGGQYKLIQLLKISDNLVNVIGGVE